VLQEQGVSLTPQQSFRLQQDVHEFIQAGGTVADGIQIGVKISIIPPKISIMGKF
jgi:hypothetical protein